MNLSIKKIEGIIVTTRKKATQSISSFLQTDEKFLLLTGTYQNEKHVLALSIILSKYPSPASVLFRVDHSSSIGAFLSPVLDLTHEPKIGIPMDIQGGYTLYIDTINPRSWRSSPSYIDIAIVYPIEILGYDDGDKCVQDLIKRQAKKIFVVSSTDSKDFGWTNQFKPVHVIFDAKEENPEYHERVIQALNSASYEKISERLPAYAAATPHDYIVRILCRRCHITRWARLNAQYPGKSVLRSAPLGKYRATCLKCGYEATDNQNWLR